jgi:hypothetical protein
MIDKSCCQPKESSASDSCCSGLALVPFSGILKALESAGGVQHRLAEFLRKPDSDVLVRIVKELFPDGIQRVDGHACESRGFCCPK